MTVTIRAAKDRRTKVGTTRTAGRAITIGIGNTVLASKEMKIMNRFVLVLLVNLAFLAAEAGHQSKKAIPTDDDQQHTAAVAIKVTDQSGHAVSGATVKLADAVVQNDILSKTSNATTACVFKALYPGAYTAKAEWQSHESESVTVEVQNGQTVNVTLKLK